MEPAPSPLRLRLFGLPQVCLDASEFPLSPTRPIQLLLYLAAQDDWQSRDDLADLFWPDRFSKIGHSNLRNLLVKTAHAAPFARIEATQHSVRFSAPCDVHDFTAALDAGDAETAVQIGAPELLAGFDSHATEPWQRWLQSKRTALLTQWVSAVQTVLALPSRPVEQRVALAEQWASRCPYDEDAVHARMAIAFERGQNGAAASLYRAFAALLRAEFGVGPSHALERFALQDGATQQPLPVHRVNTAPENAKPRAPQSALGSNSGSNDPQSALVGRRLELQQLKALLADNSVRLITLTGTGGVGKSTLMAELYAQRAADGAAHTVLVEASAARSAQDVISAIATALGIEGAQGANNALILADTLRDRPYLLMIDGAEQPDLAAPFALLLDRCPHTRLLVASRSVLQLDCEQVQVLDGFPLPDADETDADVLASNDGVRYFAAVMSQAGQPVEQTHNASHIAALVHVIEGLPLALKLLAKLTRMFSLPQLLESVRNALTGASGMSSQGLGELMPALVASFDRSWTALSPVEQTVLARLAVFPAGFDVAAACAVAGTELPVVTSLMDRSLVRPDGRGRVSLHAGVRACVLAVCPVTDDTAAAYIEHYRQRAATLVETARVKSVRPLQRFVIDDEAHVKHAWQLALNRRAYAALLSLAEALRLVMGAAKNPSSGGGWFVDCARSLLNDRNLPLALQALMLTEAASDAWNQGKLDLAAEQARQALHAAQQSNYREGTRSALAILARVHIVHRKWRPAEALTGRLARMCRAGDGEDGMQTLLDVQAMFSFMTGDYEQALRFADLLIAKRQSLGDADGVVRSLRNKWTIGYFSGDLPLAAQFMDQLIDAASASDVSRTLEASVLADAAQWYLDLGNFSQLRTVVERSDALALSYPRTPYLQLQMQAVSAALSIEAGDLGRAAQQLDLVLSTLGRGEFPVLAHEAFMATARWFRLAADRSACVGMLRAIRLHALFPSRAFDRAQAMLRELDETPSSQSEATAEDPKVYIAEAATAARLHMRSLLNDMTRRERASATQRDPVRGDKLPKPQQPRD